MILEARQRMGRSENKKLFHKLRSTLVWLAFASISLFSFARNPQDVAAARETESPLQMSSVATNRFVAVHGRRALVMGYPQTGLEVWAYPLQILSGYQIGFRPDGTTTETDGRLLLRRIIEKPDSVVRIYVGPDYVVRETLFVPLDQPSAILSYQVQSPHPVFINIHFTPVLNLMWPGAFGGQSTSWNAELPGYLISEPAHSLRAAVASPDIVSRDDTVNSTLHPESKLSFSIEPRTQNGASTAADSVAHVYINFLDSPSKDAAASIRTLQSSLTEMQSAAAAHYKDLTQSALQISTPDDDVNSALAWSEVALDQAWVCNPQLGCGIVAGYGPSRGARRPQYAWFFGGDGLIAANALISAGEYSRARDELLFIAKYQDVHTGMIWHELSQSAGYIDWSKYPYMFVHVDISFDYVNAIAHYVSSSGDVDFATAHWSSIDAAYRYCLSLIGPDGLPHIPAGKEGGDEQHRPAQDLGLSISWVTATGGFANLAKDTNHPQLAEEALKENARARQSISAHFWDAKNHFWIDGYTAQGAPIFTRRSGPAEAIEQNIFSPEQNRQILDQLASWRYQTDWGVRGVASNSSIYDPWSYATGSISALHSAEIASMFWAEDWPDTAWEIWRGIIPWNTLDALGHIHEVLAGNYYCQQTESVPEQTWSSAGLLDSAVRGLLGIEIHAEQNNVVFRPHLPADWEHVSVANIRLPLSTLSFTMHQAMDSVDLDITNTGVSTKLLFEPQIPLGATAVAAQFNGRSVQANVRQSSQDEHATSDLDLPTGNSHFHLQFVGGVSLILPHPSPKVGDPSTAIKITGIALENNALRLTADIDPSAANTLRIRTPWRVVDVKGATVQPLPDHMYEITIEHPAQSVTQYVPVSIDIGFIEQ
jgi:glycogen debranching enzyme